MHCQTVSLNDLRRGFMVRPPGPSCRPGCGGVYGARNRARRAAHATTFARQHGRRLRSIGRDKAGVRGPPTNSMMGP